MRRDLTLAGAVALVMLTALVSMQRVFTLDTWRPTTAMAVLLSLVVVAGVRRVGFGEVAAAIASLTVFIVFTYIAHLPGGPLLPGPEQWHQFTALLLEGFNDFRNEPAPAVPLPGLILLVTSGVWWVTYVAHEMLVRFRRPGLSLIAPASLWIVPLAVPQAHGALAWAYAIPFLAAAGFVLLLESEVDLSGWARGDGIPSVSSSGLAVGAVALIVAATVPGILPGYGAEPAVDWRSDRPEGYQPLLDVSNRLKLPVPRDILEVTSTRRLYWRLAALDAFNGNVWRVGRDGSSAEFRPAEGEVVDVRRGVIPREVPIQRHTLVTSTVSVLDLENFYVPVPYQATQIAGNATSDMVYSIVGGFVATTDLRDVNGPLGLVKGVVPGVEYTVTSELPDPTLEQLRGVDTSAVDPLYTSLPRDYDTLALAAEEIYAAAGATTNVDKAFALQDWFAGPGSQFRYDTNVDALRSEDALARFVLEDKVGYCEYYATAMAVMLRATGIPARTAVGFLGGTAVGEPDANGQQTYRISTTDAHAWVEVLFPDFGWIRFEPTPRSDQRTQTPTPEDLDPQLTDLELDRLAANPNTNPLPDDTDVPDNQQNPPAADTGSAATGTEATNPDRPSRLPLLAVGLLAIVGLALGASTLRGRAPSTISLAASDDRVLAAQRRVHRSAARLGIGRRSSETALETARRWTAEGRTPRTEAERLAVLAQAAAFGGEVDDAASSEAEQLGDVLVASLRASVGSSDRALAPVRLPLDRARTLRRDVAARIVRHR